MQQRFSHFLQTVSRKVFPNQEAFTFLVAVFGCAVAIYFFADTVFPITLSILLAFILYEPMMWLCNKGLNRLAVSLTFLCILFGVTILFFAVFAPLLWKEVLTLLRVLPELSQNTAQLLQQWLQEIPLIETTTVNEFVTTLVSQVTASTQQILSFSLSSLVSVIKGALYCILIPVLVFLFLNDSDFMYGRLQRVLGKDSTLLHTIWQESLLGLMHYLRGKCIEVVVVSAGSYLVLALFSMNNALLLALATGIAVLVPYVGALIVALAVLVVGLYQWGLDTTLLYVLLAYGVVQVLDAYLLVPWLFSSTLNLRPVTVLLAITFFGGLWGVWGVFVAIPLATFIKVVVSAWPKNEQITPVMLPPKDDVSAQHE